MIEFQSNIGTVINYGSNSLMPISVLISRDSPSVDFDSRNAGKHSCFGGALEPMSVSAFTGHDFAIKSKGRPFAFRLNPSLRFISDSHDYGEASFRLLAEKLKDDVRMSSSLSDMESSKYFRDILSMNGDVVRWILEDIKSNRKDPFPWFKALRLLTDEDPAKIAPRGDWVAMADKWIAWGESDGRLV
ncbi:hypothetical protein [Frateuria aurantia]|uniref:Uncharacterized protein n=1 Tax=Frateuria aurantia (strain ATCC 33424 / DSM 6220 / KCTC 2777 / LMG 1558 / NBRC 3245 / NCIMB 13370) TaxID=767434 RepID=H8L2G7_FRAAD|nr:hypothetical protein [Frateuria aurantia]AFC85434.1 hypothetical protein Fraau_0969 [Frateuria aurantia DSM 6220]